jgi:uncharacterized protein (DUF433 family)
MTVSTTPHILLDDRGVAWIDDTNVKVIEVVLDRLARGWSPEEIQFQQPHLSPAQVYAALGYYYDHQAELDNELERRWLEIESRIRSSSDTSPLRRQLQAAGKLP